MKIGGENERKTELFYHKKKRNQCSDLPVDQMMLMRNLIHILQHKACLGMWSVSLLKNTTFPIDFSFGGPLCTITNTLSQNVIQVFLLCDIYQAN